MEYSQKMNLHSPSGYAMPYDLPENEAPNIIAGYGKQIHSQSGNEFFNHGVDFKVHTGTWLRALATGIVTGISSDLERGYNITVAYSNYNDNDRSIFEVTYSHISESIVSFGGNVKAGDNVARCDDTLHMEVKFNGKEVNPIEFITVIRDNLVMQSQMEMSGKNPEIATLDFDVKTPYDDRQGEIDQLMLRFFPKYLTDLFRGGYKVPGKTEEGLRNAFTQGAQSGAYFQHMPTQLNPLGLGDRSFGIISMIQTLLIEDFLNYLALKHSMFLSGTSELEKKKFLTGLF